VNRIAELRRAMGLTQEELAYRARASLRSIVAWENGEVIPRKRNARHLARALGVELDALQLRASDQQGS
jgi:transcriptional regulator with XRE-family HTH domain